MSFEDSFETASVENSVVKKRRKNKKIKDLSYEKNE
jgi:hypothetical protein